MGSFLVVMQLTCNFCYVCKKKTVKKCGRTWRKALKLAFAPTCHRKLSNPLGAWTSQIHLSWEWYKSTTDNKMLFQFTSSQTWLSYKKLGCSQRVKRYKLANSDHPNPLQLLNVLPMTNIIRSNCIESKGHRQL
jgi:hypothetical protein